MRLLQVLRPFFSAQFIQFGIVGVSGVFVNLGALFVLDRMGVRSTVASAFAIQVSILWNFLMNERWTFSDHQAGGGQFGRLVRFQFVSLVGGLIQWVAAIGGTLLVFKWIQGAQAFEAHFADASGLLEQARLIWRSPPKVGAWLYPCQLAGIGIACGWNFLVNYHWTWASSGEEQHSQD